MSDRLALASGIASGIGAGYLLVDEKDSELGPATSITRTPITTVAPIERP
jgi:hypothetical protein